MLTRLFAGGNSILSNRVACGALFLAGDGLRHNLSLDIYILGIWAKLRRATIGLSLLSDMEKMLSVLHEMCCVGLRTSDKQHKNLSMTALIHRPYQQSSADP